ncbi:MAG: DUF1634 domain-containing protein [Acidobacteriaceae bacterium]
MTHSVLVDGQDDSVIDRRIGVLLRTGMIVSAVVVLAGGVLFLVRSGRQVPDYHVFHGVPESLKSIPQIVAGAFHGDPLAIIQFGLLLLIATPVSRVLFSVVAFALERDLLYVAISCIVFCVLMYSIIWH